MHLKLDRPQTKDTKNNTSTEKLKPTKWIQSRSLKVLAAFLLSAYSKGCREEGKL